MFSPFRSIERQCLDNDANPVEQARSYSCGAGYVEGANDCLKIVLKGLAAALHNSSANVITHADVAQIVEAMQKGLLDAHGEVIAEHKTVLDALKKIYPDEAIDIEQEYIVEKLAGRVN